jgi:MFS family permease
MRGALSESRSVSSHFSRGWAIVAVAALAMVGTLPGRSQGLGLITEPLIAELGLDRVAYATLNFWATLIGSAGALGIGRLLDRFGARLVLAVVALALGAVVLTMSQVTGLAMLAVLITLTRGLGQGALSVISIAMVGHWFVRRIDTAMAVYSVALSVGFMLAFPAVGAAIQQWGWRTAWAAVGAGLVLVLAPLAMLVVRPSPASMGLAPDGDLTHGGADLQVGPLPAGLKTGRSSIDADPGYAWTAAVGTGAFWVFAAGASLYGLVASGIGLFNESILAERGFGPDVYYRTLVVTAMTALAGNFLGGWLAGHLRLTHILGASLAVLGAGVGALPYLTTLTHVLVWASAMGLSGGAVMVLFFSVWPRVFGRHHLGRIQGLAQALTVLASAIGPLLLAWCVAWTASYAAMFQILAAIVLIVAVAAIAIPLPPALAALPAPPERRPAH